MQNLTRRAALTLPALALLPRAAPAAAAAALPGIYALPTGTAKVAAILVATPNPGAAALPGGAVAMTIDVAMTRLGAAQPITDYQVELAKRLHLIAVSADFSTFLHEHGDRPGPGGHFRIPMTFPKPGLWHVYADATPAGLPQQVMRFQLPLGPGEDGPTGILATSSLEQMVGRYAVRFDGLDLKAGEERQLTFTVLRDGRPAPDLAPYLGVAAHAVFIDAQTLDYVHVHAMPAGAGMHHAMPGMTMPAPAHVPPRLALHVTPPAAGPYLLWLQFMGAGQVRTFRFVVQVT